MSESDKAFLLAFENSLNAKLISVVWPAGLKNGMMPSSPDIDAYWDLIAPEYMADAVGEVKDYPMVSVGWAAYIGIGVAYGWDADWSIFSKVPYKFYYGERGFDDMDERIIFGILKLQENGKEAGILEDKIRSLAETAVSAIRHEQIDPLSEMAFHVFARCCKIMFRIGAAIELERLRYKYHKLD